MKRQRAKIKDILKTAMELEKKTMGLYATLGDRFRRQPALRMFWFNMARHEAGHYGALALVETVLRNAPHVLRDSAVWFDSSAVMRLRSLLTAYTREVRTGLTVPRALEMAVDIESCELEQVVVDLLRVMRDPTWRRQVEQLLIHDLGELSYMVERFGGDDALLARADALLNSRVGGLQRTSSPVGRRRSRRRGLPARRRATR